MLQQPTLIALATCSRQAIPNVVYMLQYWWLSADEIVIGDVFMKATQENVEENERVSFCVWDEQLQRSYKLKGAARYEVRNLRSGLQPGQREPAREETRQELQGRCDHQNHRGLRRLAGRERRQTYRSYLRISSNGAGKPGSSL